MLVCSPPEILCPRIHCLMIVVIALDNHPHLIYSENTPAMTSIDPSRMPWIASAFLPACTRPQSLRVAGDQTKLKASTAYAYVHCNGLDVLQSFLAGCLAQRTTKQDNKYMRVSAGTCRFLWWLPIAANDKATHVCSLAEAFMKSLLVPTFIALPFCWLQLAAIQISCTCIDSS